MGFKVGDKFKAKVPFGDKPMKVHICYVLPSTAYNDRTLIVYKVYGKHKQWWHELMCTETDMEHYVKMNKHYE
jgi:hypothetical protein